MQSEKLSDGRRRAEGEHAGKCANSFGFGASRSIYILRPRPLAAHTSHPEAQSTIARPQHSRLYIPARNTVSCDLSAMVYKQSGWRGAPELSNGAAAGWPEAARASNLSLPARPQAKRNEGKILPSFSPSRRSSATSRDGKRSASCAKRSHAACKLQAMQLVNCLQLMVNG